jgi:ABC-type dipeptide/oligopeptide/nickel transport system permease component
VTGSQDFSTAHPGFSAGRIIASGAAVTLPLALVSLAFLTVISLSLAAASSVSRYLVNRHGSQGAAGLYAVLDAAVSALAACPLFVGFWALAQAYGSETPFVFIALATVLLGGLSWDAARFLGADMLAQAETTHAIVFGTIGNPLGRAFPLPGTWSGYLFASSLPRFLPYLAGKVPAIVGAVTIAEIVFSFPGLGSTLLDALLATNTDLLVASVFILLCLNAVVTFAVKTVLFLVYPRWYEKSA